MDGLADVIQNKIIPVVSKVAPLLGSVLGTPLVGVGIALLSQAFGVDPRDVNALAKVINDEPEAAIKLKTIEYDHAETLARIAAQNFATATADKQDARKYSPQYKDFLRHMAWFVTAGFFGSMILLYAPLDIQPNERELLSMLVGMLVSKWQTIIDFFYGAAHENGGFKNGE